MKKRKSGEKGFTLIEVIVTLVLVGITAALAGMWIVSMVNGYVFAKMNAGTTQKAQLAMARLAKEFSAISAVTPTGTTGGQIIYTRTDSALGSVGPVTVSKVSSPDSPTGYALSISRDGSSYILTNSVNSSINGFSLQYCSDIPISGTQACSTSWTAGASKVIIFTLTLIGANGVESTFTSRVAPRNL